MSSTTTLTCTCGEVALEIVGRHIVSAACCCESCRVAGDRMQALPGAPSEIDDSHGTRFVLYRKDRVRVVRGADRLREFRLKPDSKTRRVLAGCCNTPMFLEFTLGHWLSVYGQLWQSGLPPLEMRTMTGDLPDGVSLPDNVPNAKTHSPAFFVKLVGAWAAMGFRSPRVSGVSGTLDGV